LNRYDLGSILKPSSPQAEAALRRGRSRPSVQSETREESLEDTCALDSPIVEDTLAHEDSTIEDTRGPSQEPSATLLKAQMSVTASDDQILNSGTRVDHYQVLRFIASGGMGEVYLARDLKLGRQVALKLVHAKLAHRAGWARRFYEEAKITATLNHPHIVTLYSVGEYRGRPYAALEYLEGQALSEGLSRIDLSFDDRLSICQSITSGVAEAHRVGFVHRDLKPSNVILADDGRPRVVDFGLATPIDSDMAREELSGTPPYMAPEQWSGDEITTATDVWAIGVIIFRALSAQMPFTEPTLDRAP
jgi:eukaryotic-like serine/threonine-protein kinase